MVQNAVDVVFLDHPFDILFLLLVAATNEDARIGAGHALERIGRIEAGETVVVGVNRYEKGEPSPLTSGPDAIMVADPEAEADQISRLTAWRAARDGIAVRDALADLRAALREGRNVMPASIAAARAGVTTGEWGDVVRSVFGHSDIGRRSFMGMLGGGTFAAALASVFPLDHAKAAILDELGAPEKTDLNIGFVPITCATPIIMAAAKTFPFATPASFGPCTASTMAYCTPACAARVRSARKRLDWTSSLASR